VARTRSRWPPPPRSRWAGTALRQPPVTARSVGSWVAPPEPRPRSPRARCTSAGRALAAVPSLNGTRTHAPTAPPQPGLHPDFTPAGRRPDQPRRAAKPTTGREPIDAPAKRSSAVPPAGERRPPVRVGAGRRSAPGRFAVGLRTGHEHQPELTDLHLVAVAESRRLDPFPVDVGAVQAAHVPDGKGAAVAVKLG